MGYKIGKPFPICRPTDLGSDFGIIVRLNRKGIKVIAVVMSGACIRFHQPHGEIGAGGNAGIDLLAGTLCIKRLHHRNDADGKRK